MKQSETIDRGRTFLGVCAGEFLSEQILFVRMSRIIDMGGKIQNMTPTPNSTNEE